MWALHPDQHHSSVSVYCLPAISTIHGQRLLQSMPVIYIQLKTAAHRATVITDGFTFWCLFCTQYTDYLSASSVQDSRYYLIPEFKLMANCTCITKQNKKQTTTTKNHTLHFKITHTKICLSFTWWSQTTLKLLSLEWKRIETDHWEAWWKLCAPKTDVTGYKTV